MKTLLTAVIAGLTTSHPLSGLQEYLQGKFAVTERPSYLEALSDFTGLIFDTDEYREKKRKEWLLELETNPTKDQGSYSEMARKMRENDHSPTIEPYLSNLEDPESELYPMDKRTQSALFRHYYSHLQSVDEIHPEI